jgi:hypothetical protein
MRFSRLRSRVRLCPRSTPTRKLVSRRRAAFWLNTRNGYTDRVPKPESVAQAGLVGWRKAIADSVAPRAASRAPVSEERLRAAIGAAFFLLSLYYVATTIARMIKSAQS